MVNLKLEQIPRFSMVNPEVWRDLKVKVEILKVKVMTMKMKVKVTDNNF